VSTIEAGRLLADLTYVEHLVEKHLELQATRHRIATRGQQVVVVVEGTSYEARAWRHALAGVIRPSTIIRGVRHQLVYSDRVMVEIIDGPRRGEHRG
jgi:hypothetical protein